MHRINSLNCTFLYREVFDQVDAAEAAWKAIQTAQRRSRRAARTAEQRAADLAADSAARSAARAAAADEHPRAEQAIHAAARARQTTNGPSHFPVHPRHRAELIGTASMFLNLLTSPFVHSQPLWQDHLHVSQAEAQPLAPGFSSPAPQQANITSASFVTPGKHDTQHFVVVYGVEC